MNKQYEENVVKNFNEITRKEFKRFKGLIGISKYNCDIQFDILLCHDIWTEEFLREK